MPDTCFDVIKTDKDIRPEDILNRWSAIPEKHRNAFKKLLQEMISLAHKYKTEAPEAESAVSRSRYVMD